YEMIRETRLTEKLIANKYSEVELEAMAFSDSDLAMLQIITTQSLSPQSAMKLIEKRIQTRVNNFTAMGKLITKRDCKREEVADYFDYADSEKPNWCCSSCQT